MTETMARVETGGKRDRDLCDVAVTLPSSNVNRITPLCENATICTVGLPR